MFLLSEGQTGEAWEPFLDVGERGLEDCFHISRFHRVNIQGTAQATLLHVSGMCCSERPVLCGSGSCSLLERLCLSAEVCGLAVSTAHKE